MATLNHTHGFSCQIGSGPALNDGSLSVPVSVTVSGLNGSFIGTVNASATAILWNTASAPVSTFTIGFIFSDQTAVIEAQTGSAANNSNLQLIAGVLFVIPGTGLAYSSSGGFAGAVTAISRVTIKNTSGNVGNVRAWFFN